MKFEQCVIKHKLAGSIAMPELKAHAAEFEGRGMKPEAAMVKAVSEALEMARMQERSIVQAVRTAYEAKGGKVPPEPAKAIPASPAKPAASPDIRASIGPASQPFYSALARTLPDMSKIADKSGMVKPEQAQTWLVARQKEGRFKADELQWSGLPDWLALQDGKVSVDQIDEFVKQNGVQVQEVMKGGSKTNMKDFANMTAAELQAAGEAEYGHASMSDFNYSDPEDRQRLVEDLTSNAAMQSEAEATYEGGAKYAGYQLPGGENYRELLLTLPDAPVVDHRLRAISAEIADQATSDERVAELRAERDRIESALDKVPVYKSSHWDEKNILAHIRFNDRTDAEGKKVLFIEEMQSDWGQAGLKQGFRAPEQSAWDVLKGKGYTVAHETNNENFDGPMWVVRDNRGDTVGGAPTEQEAIADFVRMDDGETVPQAGNESGVPRAPFVTKTEGWLQIGIKRMIRYAAENGYDKVAFVNGQQSADRYDLSKSISRIVFDDNSSGGIGKPDMKGDAGAGTLHAYDLTGKEVIHQYINSPAKAEDLIGKEAAKKLFDQPPAAAREAGIGFRRRELAGVDLKVGGEGMKSFYDKIVPQNINDVLKKLGGGKAETVNVGNDGAKRLSVGKRDDKFYIHDLDANIGSAGEFSAPYDTRAEAESVMHARGRSDQVGFTVTPEMREKALGGLPLFSKDSAASPADATIASMIKDGTSADKVLAEIEKNSDTPHYRALAAALRKLGLKTTIELDQAKSGQRFTVDTANADNAYGGYRAHDDTAILYREEGAEATTLHEFMHAATLRALQAGGDAALKIRALWKIASDNPAFKGQYGISNEEEFVAEAYTSPQFRKLLDATPAPDGNQSLWQKFKNVVRAILGKPSVSETMLDRVMAAGHDLMAENSDGHVDGGERANPGTDRRARTIEVDGVRRPITNSRGHLLGQDFASQTAFWKFFGDSKAVDADGHPLVVYHGTNQSFDSFSKDARGTSFDAGKLGEGFYFSADHRLAGSYANMARAKTKEDAPNILPAYLHLENPIIYKTGDGPLWDKLRATSKDFGVKLDPVLDESSMKPNPEWAAAFTAAATAHGHDGVILDFGPGRSEYVAFEPGQIKSASGNAGTFDPANPDIRASVRPDPVEQRDPEADKSTLSKLIGIPKELLRSAVFQTRMVAAPMSAGSDQAMAIAKDFANHNRRAASQWTAFDKVLKGNYTEDQLRKMWVAADQENDLRREGQKSTTAGLASLNAGERKTVELLHAYGEQLWQKAQDAGLVSGDGVAFWTPRMAARIVADGSAESIRQPAAEFSKDAKNLKTSASSTKQRKYETTEESEAALKAKLGDEAEYVKNIRVMPMAMAQLERAIAGRTLVNQIKAHGKVAGEDLVSTESRPDFVTFDHPALKQWRPKMDWMPADPAMIARRGYEVKADGVYQAGEKLASYRVEGGEVQKLGPMTDSNGKPVMESYPLLVRKDFAGPLKSVFTTDQGMIYRGLMNLKGGVTSMIMISPLTHNLVIWGKAMPTMISTMGWKNNLKNAGSLGMHAYFVGNRARADHELMNELVDAGLVPVSGRGMNQDVTAVANGIQPGRSMTAKAAGAVFDLVSHHAGDTARKAVDSAGQFWHETLLWDRVADMQAGMAVMMRASLMDKGLDQYASNRIATHFANRYAGMIPHEAMSESAHMLLNLSLFSKSFTMTNLGAYKDLLGGMPKDVQAQIRMRTFEIQRALGKTEGQAAGTADKAISKVQAIARKKAASVLVLDIAAMATVTSLAQALWQGQTGQQIGDDFKERLAKLGLKLKEDPMAVLGHPLDAISSLSQGADNPHGKEDRVRVGEDEQGNSYYARLPVGKVGEELKQYGNLATGLHLLHNKMSTFLRPIADLTANEDFTGKRIINPEDNVLQQVAKFGAYWVKSQMPAEEIASLGRAVQGKADTMDKLKLLGTATGVSVSKVSGGDAVAEMRYQNREQQAKLRDVLPDVREAIRRDDMDKAMKLLEDAGQDPRESARTIRQIENPDRTSKQSLRQFNRHATSEERDKLERMRSRAQ